MTKPESGLKMVPLCDLCRSGAGGECHTPSCALYLNRAPDVPVRWEEDQLAWARATAGASNTDVRLALEALSMTQCPAYNANGVCQSSCCEEPACQVDEPTEGWVQNAINLLTGLDQ